MLILGIETSCDETAVALVERGERNRIIAEEIKSQIPLHARFGGVVPEIASRTHYEVIDGLTRRVLDRARLTLSEIDAIAVTQGPGLIGSLLVGLSFAKGAACAHKKPLIPVDHINAHIESAFINQDAIRYPLIALVASGGHTSLFFQSSKFETDLIAKTRDDAVGEVMDKIAKFHGLGYPGGPILDRMYAAGGGGPFSFTIPRMSDGSEDFSFSGYKTAVLKYSREFDLTEKSPLFKDLVSSFLKSVVRYLLSKTRAAVERYSANSVVVAGGVSRNSLLRESFQREFKQLGIPIYLPEASYCTDNAGMIAWLGYEIYKFYPDRNYFDFSMNAYSRASFRESEKHR